MSERAAGGRTRLCYYLVLGWLVLLPWPLGANRDWIWTWFAALLMLIAAAAVWRGAIIARCRSAHRGVRIALCSGVAVVAVDLLRAFLAMPADVSTAASMLAVADVDAASLSALKSLSLLVLAALLIGLVNSRRRARGLLLALFVTGVAQALLALGLTLTGTTLTVFGHELGGTHLTTGTFINRNHFAGMLELAGAAGFGLLAAGLHAQQAAGSWREWLRRFGHAMLGSRFLIRVGLAVLVVALVMTRSRMGNAAFFLGLTTAGLAALVWWRPLPRVLIWLLLSIVAIDVLVLGAWVGVDKVAERMAQTRIVASPEGGQGDSIVAPTAPSASVEPGDAERWAVARVGIALWRQRPWLGHGAGSFRVVFPSAKTDEVSLFYENAHNDYVQTLVERGAFGLLMLMVAASALLWSALHALRTRFESLSRGLALTTIAAAAALAAHALVDFNLQIPSNQFWFLSCMLMGALALGLPLAAHPRAGVRGQNDDFAN